MMKPGIGSYDRFKELFDRFSTEAGKEQYLIPYFIAAHPGTTDEDMLELALWLKRNGFRLDQVQTFLPTPMATGDRDVPHRQEPAAQASRATSERVVMSARRRASAGCTRRSCATTMPRTGRCCARRCKRMGRADLIGNGKQHLVPRFQPAGTGNRRGETPPSHRSTHVRKPRRPT